MVPVATLLGAQHYKASTGFSSPNKHRTTIIATLTKSPKNKLSPIIISVCIQRRTVWKTGNYAKYVILLKYRDYYYHFYYFNIIIIIIIIIIINSVVSFPLIFNSVFFFFADLQWCF